MSDGLSIDLVRSFDIGGKPYSVTLHQLPHGLRTICQHRFQGAVMIRLIGPEVITQFTRLILGCFDPDPYHEKRILDKAAKAREVRFTKDKDYGNLGSLFGYAVDYIE